MYFSTASLTVAGRYQWVSLGLFTATANFTVDLIFFVEGNLGLKYSISLVVEVGLPNLTHFVVDFEFNNDELYPSKFDNGARFKWTASVGGIFEVVFPVDFVEIVGTRRLFFFYFRLELKYSSILFCIN